MSDSPHIAMVPEELRPLLVGAIPAGWRKSTESFNLNERYLFLSCVAGMQGKQYGQQPSKDGVDFRLLSEPKGVAVLRKSADVLPDDDGPKHSRGRAA